MQTKNLNMAPNNVYQKHGENFAINDEEVTQKSVGPVSKLAANNQNHQWNRGGPEGQQNGQRIIEAAPQGISGQGQNFSRDRNTAFTPEYRMPPLYGEESQGPNHSQPTSLQTHSSKFPIEREVVLNSGEKNSKIPILHEYKHRGAGRAAIAPDAPIKQQAWIQEANSQESRTEDQRNSQSQDTQSSASGGAVPKAPKAEDERTKSLSRTYHTIKDMISSRFGPSRKDQAEPEPTEASLNNVADELRKSSKSLDEDESKKKEVGLYNKPRLHDPPINMQQFPKNAYGQYSPNYGYQQQQTQTLPGQLPTTPQMQPSLPGQSAQLHVTHHAPPGGVQTVHQTQLSGFVQAPAANQAVQGTQRERDYVMQGPAGLTNQHQPMHQGVHSNSGQPQNPSVMKHMMQLPQNSNYQSPQQLMHQNQMHQNPRFAQQHAQNMHQRQIIQQMHQQQISNQQQTVRALPSHFNNNVTYQQQYPQSRQPMSRSQIDLPSTSRQSQDFRMANQEMYYHYPQNHQNRQLRPGMSQMPYVKPDQEAEFQRGNSGRGIEKAVSQPQLSFEDEKTETEGNRITSPKEKLQNLGAGADISADKERYEISVEDQQPELNRKGSQRQEESRPETSFGLRQNETRSSKKDKSYPDIQEGTSVQKRIEELQKRGEQDGSQSGKCLKDAAESAQKAYPPGDSTKETPKKDNSIQQYVNKEPVAKSDPRKDDLEYGMSRLKIQNQGSGSDYDKPGQSSSNVDSGRGSAVYSSGRRPMPEEQGLQQGQDSEWVDIVESELRSILEPRDVPAMAHSTLSESVSSVTPPLPPLSPHGSPRTPRNRYSSSLPYGSKPNYGEYSKSADKRNYTNSAKHRGASMSKKEAAKKFSHLFGVEAADMTSTTTGLDLDSMLDRSDSDLSTNDARTIRKQLEGLENMYSEVLKLLGGSMKKRRKARGLASYGSVSSLPTSSVSSRPIVRHHDKRRSHVLDDRMKKAKDIKSINKRFQRLESHVVTLARSVAHLSSEMRTQHLMIQEMENIRGEISTLRTQTNMAIVRSQSQPLLKDSELPALSNPSRVKKLTKFFGTEPPLIRLFLKELGYEKYANAFEKEKVGMVELPYLSDERLQKMGIPLGPRLRILQEARISVCKDAVYVV